jgi:hypothetical protein
MMNVLVATTEGQGARTDDYAWAIDGELVYIPALTCSDPGCGCGRGFAGMASARATTTAMVVERQDISANDLSNALSDSLERQGWLTGHWSEEDEDVFRDLFRRILMATSHFRPGSILERNGDYVRLRATAEPLRAPFGAGEE